MVRGGDELIETRNPVRGLQLVTVAQAAGCQAVLCGDLFYRQDLCARLPADPLPPQVDADRPAALALRLYRALGWQGFVTLEGEFSLVIWDSVQRWLIGVRDPLGGYPLFWTRQPDVTAYATGLHDLLPLLPRRTLNLDYVADFITLAGQRNELAGPRCVYEGIHRVAPGSVVRIEPDSGRVTEHRYWDWLAQRQTPASTKLPEIAAQYRATLSDAVRERAQGRVLAHVSGGMDSTSIALLAHAALGAGLGRAPLHTLSLVYDRLPVLGHERPYIEAALAGQTGLVPHRLVADDWLDFAGFADCPPHDEPYTALWRLWMDALSIRLALELDVTNILTGIGADDLLDSPPYHLAEWLRAGRWRPAWREAARWAAARRANAWSLLWPFGIAPLLARHRLDGLDRLGRFPSGTPLDRQRVGTLPDWIQPSFARRYHLSARASAQARAPYRQCQGIGLSVAVHALGAVAGNVPHWLLAAPQGLRLRHPFLDPRVLALGLGILDVRRPAPGPLKPVLGAAMPELPAPIRERRSKGHFSELYYLGLAKYRPDLERWVRDSSLVERGVLDADRLSHWLREGAWGGASARQLQGVNFALCLIRWLAQEEGQGVPG
jgi:asparagine synthase (glutamine-hydrolysing)